MSKKSLFSDFNWEWQIKSAILNMGPLPAKTPAKLLQREPASPFGNDFNRLSRYVKLLPALFIFLAAFLGTFAGAGFAASEEEGEAINLGDRGRMYSPQSVRATVNHGGPEDWPENGGLSTSKTAQTPGGASRDVATPPLSPPEIAGSAPRFEEPAAPIMPRHEIPMVEEQEESPKASQPAEPVSRPVRETHVPEGGRQVGGTTAGKDTGLQITPKEEPKEEAPREVIYVDEAGNPVPKPPEPEKMLEEASTLMEQGKYDDALAILNQIREIPNLAPDLLEKTLYGISDGLWARYADNPLAGYEPIISSTNEALNSNIRSRRVPDALLRLGLANINVGNLGEASGYIMALMRRFPDFPGVAQGFTALGKAQLKEGKDAQAEQSFGIVLDKYPESSQLQDASVGLATALVHQKKHERAQVILDFISKRWPRYYINDPDFLLMQAANDETMGREGAARDLYWLYVNLDPKRETNAPLLLKMGDSYLKEGNGDAADFVYSEIERDFPGTPSAIKAHLRLAEKGIYDAPINYAEMSGVFSKIQQPSLFKVYNDVINSPEATPDTILARLKKAMWLYWDKQYPEAMGEAANFIDDYPENSELPEARNVLWESFRKELGQSLDEGNYGRILLLWNGFPYIRERYGKMDGPLRYALAQGWLERGDEQKSFELLTPFLSDPMDPEYGEAAFTQFFNAYLKAGAWDKILDLGNLVKNWKMKPELQNQLDYAMALSAQNLNLGAAALNRWKELAHRTDIPLYQQAYATYFLAKDAEYRRDIRQAYEGNRKVVEMFTKLADERSDKADPERIKESISSLMDICEVGNRVPEALEWLDRYRAYVDESSPEFPGLRFREARLYRKLGDSHRAQALLESIASNFPDSPFAPAAQAELRTFDVSRDLQRYMPNAPPQKQSGSTGSTSGNWSSSGPTASNTAQ